MGYFAVGAATDAHGGDVFSSGPLFHFFHQEFADALALVGGGDDQASQLDEGLDQQGAGDEGMGPTHDPSPVCLGHECGVVRVTGDGREPAADGFRLGRIAQLSGENGDPLRVLGHDFPDLDHFFLRLPLQCLHEFFGAVGIDEPGAFPAAFDPDELVGAGDVELHDASFLGPQPAEPAPQASGPDPHAPADFTAQLLLSDDPDVGDALAPDLPALEGPDDLDMTRMDVETSGPEPGPDPEVNNHHEQGRGRGWPASERRDSQKQEGQGQEDQGEDADGW